MPVISFASPKGGVGKTTAAVILAGELVAAGRRVCLIDADPNRPVVRWAALQPLPPGLSIVADESAETIIDTIEAARAVADFVIVDLEGTATDRVGYAIARSDLVLIPLQPSVLDATEATKAMKLVRQMSRVANRDIPYRLFFSRIAAAIRERTAKDLEAQIAANGAAVLAAAIVDRAAFRALFSLGGTLDMLDAKDVSGLKGARDNALAFAQGVVEIFAKRKAA
ncbi:MAG TPA: ParA family protein [Pseudolabrys sp.]